MTAQSCGKWNKQHNHFLSNFQTFSLIPHRGHRRSKGNGSSFSCSAKNTHCLAPDLGFYDSSAVLEFDLSFLAPLPSPLPETSQISGGTQGLVSAPSLCKPEAPHSLSLLQWLPLSGGLQILFSHPDLLPEYLIHIPAALFPTGAMLFSFWNLHLNMVQINVLPSYHVEVQECCYYLVQTVGLQILRYPHALLLSLSAIYQLPNAPSHQFSLHLTNPHLPLPPTPPASSASIIFHVNQLLVLCSLSPWSVLEIVWIIHSCLAVFPKVHKTENGSIASIL